jgi:hypothetical protein
MTTTYDAFFPEILPYAPNCPEMVARNAVRNAVIEFCTETWYWTHDTFPVVGTVGEGVYTIDLPDNTKMLSVVDAWYDKQLLRPTGEPLMRNIYINIDWRTVVGNPRFYMHEDPANIIIVPAPNVPSIAGGLTAQIAVAPTRASTGCLDSLYERYAEVMAQGALGRLLMTPGQPYSDPQGAIAALREFRAKMMDAKALVQRGKTRASLQARFLGRNGA